jgi:hypothetical protein
MNAKKAKQLRALARTVAIEHTAYLPMKSQVIFAPTDVMRAGPSAIWLGQCVLDPKCVRAHYQQFKREARA